ncbi:MAG: NAD-dependent epimerase/dehydratase family protein [bacterium]|nr:NAD-dependent epimerase/dehydratase family protein [bacterium]
MRILLLGGNGFLGPHVVTELEGDHELVVTDVAPVKSPHETQQVDIAHLDQVRRAARGTDVIINCAVTRTHRRRAFEVNTLGTLNALTAAVELGHGRLINTGPRFTLAGPAYLDTDFGLHEQIPPHPGTLLYALSKSLGHEICRIFADQYPIHVLTMIVSSFVAADPPAGWRGEMNPFAVTYADAARAIRCALEVDSKRLPSRCEAFFVTVDLPQQQCLSRKAYELLRWTPRDRLEAWWHTGSAVGSTSCRGT